MTFKFELHTHGIMFELVLCPTGNTLRNAWFEASQAVPKYARNNHDADDKCCIACMSYFRHRAKCRVCGYGYYSEVARC